MPGQLARMLEAQHPATGRKLGRGFGEKSARAFDATLSAPKSVSLLWALTSDETVRAEVLAAHDAAVETALGWLERHGTVTRRGRDGVDQVDACGLTVALFRHHTSRSLDPQLHTYAIVWSKVQDRTGKWLSLDARFLVRQQRSIGWMYDAALRVELTRRLGVEWEAIEPGLGQADVAGVPVGLRKLFSTRSGQVEVKLARLQRKAVRRTSPMHPERETDSVRGRAESDGLTHLSHATPSCHGADRGHLGPPRGKSANEIIHAATKFVAGVIAEIRPMSKQRHGKLTNALSPRHDAAHLHIKQIFGVWVTSP